ncbi:50S ribosomal protein L6 [Candidatus Microgenomates bacterium]|nr:50S ribosomal protein L6 [Candidatus Microgenomates bacterium]
MSRIGRQPIVIPAGVEVEIKGRQVRLSGPKGTLGAELPAVLTIKQEKQQLRLSPKRSSASASKLYGVARTMLSNLVHGVTEGWQKQLEIHGVGYRAQVSEQTLSLNLGFSHPVEYQLPDGISASVEANIITISGIDKQKVGQVAAEIRSLRQPEPYKGKGVRYVGEHVRRKVGKAATKAVSS